MSGRGVFSYENRTMLILGLAFGVAFFDRLSLGFLAPFLEDDLNLSNTKLGMLASALALTWAFSGFGLSALSDYFGKRKTLLVSSVTLFSICSVTSGLATSFVMLLVARLLLGLVAGPVLPLSQSIMAAESSAHRRGFNMGVVQNFFSSILGDFAAPLILVAIAAAYGWRTALYIAAIPSLIVALLIAFFIREPSDKIGGASPNVGRLVLIKSLLGYRNIWVCAVISCLMLSSLLIQLTFLPIYLVKSQGLTPAHMSYVMSALGISSVLSSMLVPALSDRFGRRPIMALFAFVGVLSPGAAIFLVTPLALLLPAVAIGFLVTGCFPLFMATIPSETVPSHFIATALGFIIGLGNLIGGFGAPTAAGMAGDVFGVSAPLWIAAALLLGAGLVSFLLNETAPRIVGRMPPNQISTA
ncbi:MFS transporter [Labrys neptuniae]